MPFSPQNRMKTFLVMALLIDSIIVIGGVVWLQKYNNAPGSTPLAYAIIAFGGLGVKELLVMLHTHQEARQTRHDLRGAVGQATNIIQSTASQLLEKTNGGLSKAVQEVGEQVRVAEREQLLDDPRCIERVEKAVKDAAEMAARRVVAELRRDMQG